MSSWLVERTCSSRRGGVQGHLNPKHYYFSDFFRQATEEACLWMSISNWHSWLHLEPKYNSSSWKRFAGTRSEHISVSVHVYVRELQNVLHIHPLDTLSTAGRNMQRNVSPLLPFILFNYVWFLETTWTSPCIFSSKVFQEWFAIALS